MAREGGIVGRVEKSEREKQQSALLLDYDRLQSHIKRPSSDTSASCNICAIYTSIIRSYY